MGFPIPPLCCREADICTFLVDVPLATSDFVTGAGLPCCELTPCILLWEAPTLNVLAPEEVCDILALDLLPFKLTFWLSTEALLAALELELPLAADTNPWEGCVSFTDWLEHTLDALAFLSARVTEVLEDGAGHLFIVDAKEAL